MGSRVIVKLFLSFYWKAPIGNREMPAAKMLLFYMVFAKHGMKVVLKDKMTIVNVGKITLSYK